MMTRAEVVEHLTDVLLLHGFVGSNASLPATVEDVIGLFIQIGTKVEDLCELLELQRPPQEDRMNEPNDAIPELTPDPPAEPPTEKTAAEPEAPAAGGDDTHAV